MRESCLGPAIYPVCPFIAKHYGGLPAKEIVFWACPSHNARVIGAFLNAFGILFGALFGLVRRQPLSARAQDFFKAVLGLLTVLLGLHLLWTGIHGTFLSGCKQLFLAALAVVLGNWVGKLLGLQLLSNRLGRYATGRLSAAQTNPPARPADGLTAASLLFCAAPLGLIGAVTDGLTGFFYLLALKALMDGLATASFIKIYRWPVALAAIPVFVFLDGLTWLTHDCAAPFLEKYQWTDSVNTAAGLVVCATALVIFGIRRVELANYLPALILAPLLAHLLG